MLLENLSLTINQKVIFEAVNLDLKNGHWTAILGKSGTGKTTILRVLAGLDVVGNLNGKVNTPKEVAWMGQEDLLYPWLSVLDNILLYAKFNKLSLEPLRQKALALLQEVGLIDKQNAYIKTLSGGQKQRVALLRTLLNPAQLVLMDEPFSALDAITKRTTQSLFKNLLKSKTVLLITHDVIEALTLCDEIFILQDHKPAHLEKVASLSGKTPRAYDDAIVLKQQSTIWQLLEDQPTRPNH